MADKQAQSRRNRRQQTGLRTTWCCAAGIPSSPDRRSSHQFSKERSDEYSVSKKPVNGKRQKEKTNKKKSKAEEAKCMIPSIEVTAIIKQQRILSPGRVSPLIEPSANQQPEPAVASPLPQTSPSPTKPTRASPIKQGSTLQQIMNHEAEPDSKVSPSPPLKLQAKLPAFVKSNRASRGIERGSDDRRGGDVKLTLRSKDGRAVTLDLHSEVLITQSRYFCSKLSECPSIDGLIIGPPYSVEVCDCPDLKSYQDAIELMYCPTPTKRLMQGNASSVLGILEVSLRISFETGVKTCLECLEAMPWTEEDEERVRTLLTQFHLEKYAIQEVLGRLHLQEQTGSEKLLLHVIQSVTRGKDEKARREMKHLVSRMLRENSSQQDDPPVLLKDDLYSLCHGYLDSLIKLFMQATNSNIVNDVVEDRGSLITQIARQVDNLSWLFEILIDRHIADDFVRIWANHFELLELYRQTSAMVRYELSRLTAKLFMALGKGQILCPWDVRYTLLHNWLQPLVDDFGWIQRCCKGLDMKVVEESVSQTILTLPMQQQQSILMCWLECFSNSRNDGPNLHTAFEVWWRRSFLKPPEVHATTADLTC